jgi:hypothetical protein
MTRYLVAMLAATGLLVAGAPAAAGPHERIGERLNLFVGTPATFSAGQPFHVAHGWVGGVGDSTDHDAFGKHSFTLDLDGTSVDATFVERFVAEDGTLSRWWVFNFPAGLPVGTHVFTPATAPRQHDRFRSGPLSDTRTGGRGGRT